MSAIKDYSNFIKSYVSPFLRGLQFDRYRDRFYRKREETTWLVEFQRSSKSSSSKVLFTVNLGIRSLRLAEFYGDYTSDARFPIDSCHWRKRIGLLMKVRRDIWWGVSVNISLEVLFQSIRDAIMEFGLPELERLGSDTQLYEYWKSGRANGLTNFERLMNLSVLARQFEDEAEIEKVATALEELARGSQAEDAVAKHLQKLQLRGMYG